MSDSVRPHRWQPIRLPHLWDSPGKNTGVGCHFLLQCMKEESESEVTQSCLTLSDPMDCSLPGSSVHGIFQAKVLEWGATAFSNSTETPSQTCGCEALPRMVPSTQGPGHWVMGRWDLSGDDRPCGKFPGECACTAVRKDTSESEMISKSKEGISGRTD